MTNSRNLPSRRPSSRSVSLRTAVLQKFPRFAERHPEFDACHTRSACATALPMAMINSTIPLSGRLRRPRSRSCDESSNRPSRCRPTPSRNYTGPWRRTPGRLLGVGARAAVPADALAARRWPLPASPDLLRIRLRGDRAAWPAVRRLARREAGRPLRSLRLGRDRQCSRSGSTVTAGNGAKVAQKSRGMRRT